MNAQLRKDMAEYFKELTSKEVYTLNYIELLFIKPYINFIGEIVYKSENAEIKEVSKWIK